MNNLYLLRLLLVLLWLQNKMINLLPQEKKDTLKNSIKKKSLSTLFVFLGILFLIFSALISPSVLLLNAKEKSLREILSRSEEERRKILKDTEMEIRKYNQRANLYLQSKNFESVPDFFIRKSIEAKPSNISLNNFSFSRDESIITLDASGLAENREALLSYVETLKILPNIKEVTVPISSFVKGENLEFTVRIVYDKK